MTDALGADYDESYAYSALGMLATAEGPYSTNELTYTYDGVGNRTVSQYDGPGGDASFTYNYVSGKNRLDHVNIWPKYESDAYGNIVVYEDGVSTVEFNYNLNGQLKSVEDRESGFDALFNVYDHLGQRVYKMSQGAEPWVMFNYDLAGRMLNETHLTDFSTTTSEYSLNPTLDYVYLGNHRVAVLTGTVNAGPSPCFVATAAYGTAMSVDIQALRELRERVLKKAAVGVAFVNWYYRNGPKYARWLNDNPEWKRPVRWGLWIPVGMTMVAFYGDLAIIFTILSLGVLCAFVLKRRLKWRTWRTTWVTFALTFAMLMVYSMFVNVPESRATRAESDAMLTHEGVYFIYEDHIGRPIMMTQYADTDANGSYATTGTGENEHYIWKANYRPFGQLNDSFDSVGITVGTGNYAISWVPPFRFPGQYADPEIPNEMMYYNQWRFYIPSLGRYTSNDLLDFQDGESHFAYAFREMGDVRVAHQSSMDGFNGSLRP